MRVVFVHDWEPDWEQEYTWRDGLAAAIKVLSERHELRFYTCGKEDAVIPHPYFPIHVSTNIMRDVQAFAPDRIIMWGDCTRPNAEPLSSLGVPMALCFAGGNPDGPTARYFDHFFVESEVYKSRFEAMGRSVSTAFGTNTALFAPLPDQRKCFGALFPATFALWKRHDLFAKATAGLSACAVGYMYDTHETECWKACEKAGNLVLPHVSAEALRRLYAASHCVVIPSMASGGSQRTVLEAMAMNIPVVVCEDSDKTTEYVREGGGAIVPPEPSAIREAIDAAPQEANTRDYILSKWTETHYADAMDRWLTS